MKYFPRDPVLLAASFLAAATAFLVAPDEKYISYIDLRTMALLFSLMVIVSALSRLGLFEELGRRLLLRVRSRAAVASVLVFLPFFSSMLITNDVALLTFVPFGAAVLPAARMDALLVPVFVLQTLAANLGSMLTPMGNPQNLYLYARAGLSAADFLSLMLPYTAASAALLALSLFLLARADRGRKVHLALPASRLRAGPRLFLWLGMLLLALAAVLRLLPAEMLALLVLAAAITEDRTALVRADYTLLATFLAFFIFIGNAERLPALAALTGALVSGREMPAAVLLSQFVSNVPAALFLSGFTGRTAALIVGTNLGGLGTLIASMASLITWREISARAPERRRAYFLLFTAANLLFLVPLFALALLLENF